MVISFRIDWFGLLAVQVIIIVTINYNLIVMLSLVKKANIYPVFWTRKCKLEWNKKSWLFFWFSISYWLFNLLILNFIFLKTGIKCQLPSSQTSIKCLGKYLYNIYLIQKILLLVNPHNWLNQCMFTIFRPKPRKLTCLV